MKRILVPISGGKDSQACLKLALETQPDADIAAFFCDTQFEHPRTYDHLVTIKALYGVPIFYRCEGSVLEKVLKYDRFPSFASRHCTDELKIRPTRKFLLEYALTGPVEVWYGMRSQESSARRNRYADLSPEAVYPPHIVLPKKYPKYLHTLGVEFRLPIKHWVEDDVFDYLAGDEHPLYDEGFDRIGCFPCLAAGQKAKKHAFEYDAFGKEQHARVVWLENKIGKSVWSTDGTPTCYEGCATCAI